MIKITVTLNEVDKKINAIEVKGHAYSAEPGKDLICAAVSAVVIGGFNALVDVKKYDVKLEKGNAFVKVNSNYNDNDQIVLKTILTQLKTIAEDNHQFVSVKEILND